MPDYLSPEDRHRVQVMARALKMLRDRMTEDQRATFQQSIEDLVTNLITRERAVQAELEAWRRGFWPWLWYTIQHATRGKAYGCESCGPLALLPSLRARGSATSDTRARSR